MVKCIRCGKEKPDPALPCPVCKEMDESLLVVMRISDLRAALTRIQRGDFEDAAHAIEIAEMAMKKDDAVRI